MKTPNTKQPTSRNWYEEGRRLQLEGRFSRAIQALNLAIDHKIELGRSYFIRAICHYKLANYRQATIDLEAAALMGCTDAQLWSKYDLKRLQTSQAVKKKD